MNINFITRPNKGKLTKHTVTLYAQVSGTGIERFRVSTGIVFPEKYWSEEKKKLVLSKGQIEGRDIIELRRENIKSWERKALRTYTVMMDNDIEMSQGNFELFFNSKTNNIKVSDFYPDFLKTARNKVKEPTIVNYDGMMNIIRSFEEVFCETESFNLEAYRDGLLSYILHNTTRQNKQITNIFKLANRVLADAAKKKRFVKIQIPLPDFGPTARKKGIRKRQAKRALSKKEILEIHALPAPRKHRSKLFYRNAIDGFCFAHYHGQRVSDWYNLKFKNILIGDDGEWWLNPHISTKSNDEATEIPLDPIVKRFIPDPLNEDPDDYIFPHLVRLKQERVGNRFAAKINECLKSAAKRAGIDDEVKLPGRRGNKDVKKTLLRWQHMSTHYARVGFATKMEDAKIASTKQIMAYMGIESIETYWHYVTTRKGDTAHRYLDSTPEGTNPEPPKQTVPVVPENGVFIGMVDDDYVAIHLETNIKGIGKTKEEALQALAVMRSLNGDGNLAPKTA